MWGLSVKLGRPLHPEFIDSWNMPHTVSSVFLTRQRYESFMEASEPPEENIWDYPHLIKKYFDKLYPKSKKNDLEDESITASTSIDLEE